MRENDKQLFAMLSNVTNARIVDRRMELEVAKSKVESIELELNELYENLDKLNEKYKDIEL